jgi:hypothetical protein
MVDGQGRNEATIKERASHQGQRSGGQFRAPDGIVVVHGDGRSAQCHPSEIPAFCCALPPPARVRVAN